MTEREMEDLIAAHPRDFFPRKDMVLKGPSQASGDSTFCSRTNIALMC